MEQQHLPQPWGQRLSVWKADQATCEPWKGWALIAWKPHPPPVPGVGAEPNGGPHTSAQDRECPGVTSPTTHQAWAWPVSQSILWPRGTAPGSRAL